jgi:hypothetical protein
MQYDRSNSYGKDEHNDLATRVFDEMPSDYQDDWRDLRDRISGH